MLVLKIRQNEFKVLLPLSRKPLSNALREAFNGEPLTADAIDKLLSENLISDHFGNVYTNFGRLSEYGIGDLFEKLRDYHRMFIEIDLIDEQLNGIDPFMIEIIEDGYELRYEDNSDMTYSSLLISLLSNSSFDIEYECIRVEYNEIGSFAGAVLTKNVEFGTPLSKIVFMANINTNRYTDFIVCTVSEIFEKVFG